MERKRYHFLGGQELRRLYEDDQLSLQQIGDMFGASAPTIAKRLRVIGVTIRKQYGGKKRKPCPCTAAAPAPLSGT